MCLLYCNFLFIKQHVSSIKWVIFCRRTSFSKNNDILRIIITQEQWMTFGLVRNLGLSHVQAYSVIQDLLQFLSLLCLHATLLNNSRIDLISDNVCRDQTNPKEITIILTYRYDTVRYWIYFCGLVSIGLLSFRLVLPCLFKMLNWDKNMRILIKRAIFLTLQWFVVNKWLSFLAHKHIMIYFP